MRMMPKENFTHKRPGGDPVAQAFLFPKLHQDVGGLGIIQCHNFLPLHCPQKGPYYRDQVPIRTFMAFCSLLVPINISGSIFSVLWLHSHKECQFSLHVYSNELTGKFDFFLCLRIKFHKPLFWVPISQIVGSIYQSLEVPISFRDNAFVDCGAHLSTGEATVPQQQEREACLPAEQHTSLQTSYNHKG